MTRQEEIYDRMKGCLYGQAVGDADTNAAVACAILGAKFGYHSIPPYYIENLYNEKDYRAKCEAFVLLAMGV